MASIRIATFNVENLLQRFDFYKYGKLTVEPALRILGVEKNDQGYFPLRRSLHVALTDDSRQMTAQAIRDCRADLICLQEVDSRDVLDDFNREYLKKSTGIHYGWRRLEEGNDPRGIDVCAMAKSRFSVTSHAHFTYDELDLYNNDLRDHDVSEGDRVFRRDCLELEISVGGNKLTVFACHFKSMSGGRDTTRPIREAEARAVRSIIEAKFLEPQNAHWVVVGDLNDYTEHEDGTPATDHSLDALLGSGFSENLVARREVGDRWTHYYPHKRTKHQLDYVLASPAVAKLNPDAIPDIIRAGQPWRVPGLETLARYPRVGFDRPKASDHCPVAVDIRLADQS